MEKAFQTAKQAAKYVGMVILWLLALSAFLLMMYLTFIADNH